MSFTVYTIAKNEAHEVEEWYESTKSADHQVIVDTGSTDGTVEIAKKLGITVHQIRLPNFRFDMARNIALSLCPKSEWYFSIDMDERVNEGWRDTLEANKDCLLCSINVKMVFNRNPDGSDGTVYPTTRIHNDRCSWVYPIHEVIDKNSHLYLEDIVLNHYPKEKERKSYLRMLENWEIEAKGGDRRRALFYLGREYKYEGDIHRANSILQSYLKVSDWAEERSAAYIMLGDIERNAKKAEAFYLKAAAEAPHMREPWVKLAHWHLLFQNPIEAAVFAKRALTIRERSKTYINEDYAWDGSPERIIEDTESMIERMIQEQEATDGKDIR